MAAAACSASRVPPSTTVRIAPLMSWSSDTNWSPPTLAIGCRNRHLPHRRSPSQEVRQEIIARRRQNRLWVELDAFDRQPAVSQSHDQAVDFGGNLEFGW